MTLIRHKCRSAHAASAFTLMEMMLALAVSAIVVAAIGGVFYSALRLRNSAVAALDEGAPVHQALAFLRRDLQNALPPTGFTVGNLSVGSSSDGMLQNAGIEVFTSTGSVKADSQFGDIQEVGYELRPATQPGRGSDLFRIVNRNLLATTPQYEEQFLMGNVQSMEFSCYDGTTWLSSWDATMGNTNLPFAVKVVLKLAAQNNSGDQGREPIEMVVPMVALARTNQLQIASGQ